MPHGAMKTPAIAATLLSLIAAGSVAGAPETPPDLAALVAGNNALACDLYAQLKGQNGNLFFSPFSVSTALAMTYAGAKGATATQMAQALHFTLAPAALHPAFAALADRIRAVEAAGHVKLSVANSLWPQRNFPLLDAYTALVRQNYGVAVTAVDYQHAEPAARAQINAWVADKTQDRIKDLIASPLDPFTRLVLVNAVYFKGSWETPFKAAQTQRAPFFAAPGNSVQTPLMAQMHTFPYAELDVLQLVELPYAGRELSMLVLLPKGNATVADIEKALSPDRLQQWKQRLAAREVRVFLPKFKVTWGTSSLRTALQALAMRDAFDGAKADFSGMDGHAGWLSISDVLHKAFVDVNEEGTEAAAATAVVMRSLAVAAPPPVFRADHPFLFLIQENRTGSVLFLGRITNPVQE